MRRTKGEGTWGKKIINGTEYHFYINTKKNPRRVTRPGSFVPTNLILLEHPPKNG